MKNIHRSRLLKTLPLGLPASLHVKRRNAGFLKSTLLFCAGILSFGFSSLAAPPPNDNFSSAVALTGSTPSSTVDNTQATNEASDPPVAGYRTVWWTYRPSATGRLTVSTTGSATFSKNAQVYLGTGATSQRAVAGTNGSLVVFTFPVTANTDYHISVGNRFSGDAGGVVVLGLALDDQADVSSLYIPYAATMANDTFAQKPLLTGDSVAAIGYNVSATNEVVANEPTTSGFLTLWWTYRPSQNGRLTVTTSGSDAITKNVAVYLGSNFPSLRLVAQDYGSTSVFTIPVTANTDYHVSVGNRYNGDPGGSIVLGFALDTQADVSFMSLPARASAANDLFAAQVALTGGTVSAIGYNPGASQEGLEPAATHYRTIWWNWTSPAAGTATIDLGGSDSITKIITVWRGATFSTLQSVATSSSANQPAVSFTATAGETYRIAAANYYNGDPGGSIVMTIAGPSGAAGNAVPAVTVDQAIHLRWFTANGLRYQVQRTTDLSTWTNVGSLITGNGSFKDYFDPITPQSYFYRIFIQP